MDNDPVDDQDGDRNFYATNLEKVPRESLYEAHQRTNTETSMDKIDG